MEVKTSIELVKLDGQEVVERVHLCHSKTKEEHIIEVDDVIVNFGFVSSIGPIKNWGLEIEKGNILVNSKGETNIPGIYAAGILRLIPVK